ncbi:FUSC family protein [Psychrobacter sp. I-STPA10]|uniref:FUSC family protein n=1 Tax=Psychrobacter sp. I-STPA10 TaxID=2585769 RepID=UPI001E42ADE4|nr:FUSC family protein [Psychrobacter sp. I-STPA10]
MKTSSATKSNQQQQLPLYRRLWQWLTAPFVEPYARYQHSMLLHSVRLGCAVVFALIFNRWTQLPHGEWTAITVFIILGLLQYQGAIYTKAYERVLGTVCGIVIGSLLLTYYQFGFGGLLVYYLLVGIVSATIGYVAVKNLGYIGLLTGITMCMIISDPNNLGPEGYIRATNVLIGTLIAVAATIILPLKSTLMWRFLMAKNLLACSDIYAGILQHIKQQKELHEQIDKPSSYLPETLLAHEIPADSRQRPFDSPLTIPVADNLRQALQKINQCLLSVRSHIAATAKETGMSIDELEHIQHTHRNIIGTIDLLLAAAPRLASIQLDADNKQLLIHYQKELNQAMRHIAMVLMSPSDEVFRPITRIQVSEYPSVHRLAFEWQGYFWLTQTLQAQLQTLSDALKDSKPQWYKASGLRYQRREQKRAWQDFEL